MTERNIDASAIRAIRFVLKLVSGIVITLSFLVVWALRVWKQLATKVAARERIAGTTGVDLSDA